MIKTLADRPTEELVATGRSKRVPPDGDAFDVEVAEDHEREELS